MPQHQTVLTDVDRQIHLPAASLEPSRELQLAGSDQWSIRKFTLRGGLSDGVDVVTLDSGAMSVEILPTRGMGIWRARRRDTPVGWNSPVKRPVHPAFVNAHDRNGLGWLNGFNELLCRCGLAFNGPPGVDPLDGSPITLHGRISNLPAHFVEAIVSDEGPGTLSVRGVVEETSMFGTCLRLTTTCSMTAGGTTLSIADEVHNLSAKPAELELLYHLNIGPPLLEAGAKLSAPVRAVIPQTPRAAAGIQNWSEYSAPETGFAEQVYFLELLPDENSQSRVLLANAAGDRGLSLQFDPRQLPYFIVWKNTQAEEDGYVTGLEPSTNYPNFKGFERDQGRVIQLAPGARWKAAWSFSVHDNPSEIEAAQARIAAIQSDHPPKLHSQPQPGYSPIF